MSKEPTDQDRLIALLESFGLERAADPWGASCDTFAVGKVPHGWETAVRVSAPADDSNVDFEFRFDMSGKFVQFKGER